VAASAGVATPIKPWKPPLGSGTALPVIRRMAEKAGQSIANGPLGTPCQVDVAGATGFIIENPAIVSVATAIIAGFTVEPFNNLTSSGVAQVQSTGYAVQNQSSAKVIAIGSPPNDGTIGFYQAIDETTFVGTLGNSNTAANATVAQADLTKTFGLTQDATNKFWYIDNFITTAANGACVEIVELIDAVGTLNGREAFKVTHVAQQLQV
jgi:hypothetical protein